MADKQKPRRDDALALSLACGATVEAAARQVGVSDRTVYRRIRDPEFQKRVKEARTDLVRRSAGLLSAASGDHVHGRVRAGGAIVTLHEWVARLAGRLPGPRPKGVPADPVVLLTGLLAGTDADQVTALAYAAALLIARTGVGGAS